MTKDSDYWKNEYKEFWNLSSARENALKEIIENETNLKVESYGFGVGSTKFFHGSALENGFEKGQPDLILPELDICIEVTGPLTKNVKPGADLWFRPDKISFAMLHRYDCNEFFASNFESTDQWYILHFNDEMMTRYEKDCKNHAIFRKVTTKIRGRTENFVAIKSNDQSIGSLDVFLYYLKQVKISIDNPEGADKYCFRKLRQQFGLSQKEFCKKFSVPLSSCQDWEGGRKKPPEHITKMMNEIIRLMKSSNI